MDTEFLLAFGDLVDKYTMLLKAQAEVNAMLFDVSMQLQALSAMASQIAGGEQPSMDSIEMPVIASLILMASPG